MQSFCHNTLVSQKTDDRQHIMTIAKLCNATATFGWKVNTEWTHRHVPTYADVKSDRVSWRDAAKRRYCLESVPCPWRQLRQRRRQVHFMYTQSEVTFLTHSWIVWYLTATAQTHSWIQSLSYQPENLCLFSKITSANSSHSLLFEQPNQYSSHQQIA